MSPLLQLFGWSQFVLATFHFNWSDRLNPVEECFLCCYSATTFKLLSLERTPRSILLDQLMIRCIMVDGNTRHTWGIRSSVRCSRPDRNPSSSHLLMTMFCGRITCGLYRWHLWICTYHLYSIKYWLLCVTNTASGVMAAQIWTSNLSGHACTSSTQHTVKVTIY